MKMQVILWNSRMAQHDTDTNGFVVDMYAPENGQWLLDTLIVAQETLDYAEKAIPHVKPKQKAALKRSLVYLTSLREQQKMAHAARFERFLGDQRRLTNEIKQRKNGD
jgi:hypothetical protein